jgi:hypothetical protein
MKAISQLPYRSKRNKRTAIFSAWAISLVFASIAATSFAVDQSVMTAAALAEDQTRFQSLGDGDCLGKFRPFQLIKSLIGPAHDRR